MARIHANVLGEEAQQDTGREAAPPVAGAGARAAQENAPVERLVEQATHGLVFVDEVDKIRSQVGGQPNVAGIRAQEALLTLIENESVPFTMPDWAGGATVNVDSSGLLFVCAGAFEGLYDAVYYRVTAGRDQGALRPVTVVDEGGRARGAAVLAARLAQDRGPLRYGVSPQFLSRFDAVVLLEALGEEALMKIFQEGASRACASRRPTSRASAAGSRSRRTPPSASSARRRASRAWAPARSEVLPAHRGPAQFDRAAAPEGGVVRIDLERVKEALARDQGQLASTTSGLDSPSADQVPSRRRIDRCSATEGRCSAGED